jgi:DNA-binding MarR family transcriptional regulator
MGTTNEPNTELEEEVGGLAQELLRRLDLLAGAAMHEDISYSKYKMLSLFQKHGPITIGGMAKAISSAQSTTSEMATRLMKAGLVKKLRGSPGGTVTDGRVVTVELSDHGRQMVEQHRGRVHQGYLALIARMPPAERDAFLGALQQLDALLRKGMDG